MANAFWGGFARSLQGSMEADAQVNRDLRREDARLALEKKYAGDVIANTEMVGDEMVSYNKYGDVVKRRPLTITEREMRDANVGKTKADTRKSVADAGISEFNLTNAPTTLDLERRRTEATIRASNASADAALGGLELRRKELDLQFGDTTIPKDIVSAINTAEQLITSVGADGINSPDHMINQFQRDIDAALARKDYMTVRRLTNQVIGALGNKQRKAEAEASFVPRGSVFPTVPLDGNPPGAN